MTSPRKPGFVLPVAVTLTVLLALYVGAYYAMVKPRIDVTHIGPVSGAWVDFVPQYPWRTMDRFFSPVHRLDRRLRPHVWGPKDLSIETESLDRRLRPYVWEPK